MGFLAGLGDAFETSYQRAADRRANREDDLFKVKYNDFLKHQEEKRKLERDQAEKKRRADTLYSAYGQGLPDAARNNLYDLVDAGMTNEQIQEYLQQHQVASPAQPQTTISSGSGATDNPTAADDSGYVDPTVKVVADAPTDNPVPVEQGDTSTGTKVALSVPASTPSTPAATATQATADDTASKPIRDGKPGFGFHHRTTEERVNARMDEATNGEYHKYLTGTESVSRNAPGVRLAFAPKGSFDDPYVTGVTEANFPVRLAQAQEAGATKSVERLRKIQQGYLDWQSAQAGATQPYEAYIMIGEDGSRNMVQANGYFWVNPAGEKVSMSNVSNAVFTKAKGTTESDLQLIKAANSDKSVTRLGERRNAVAMLVTDAQQITDILKGNPNADTYASGVVRFAKNVGFESQAFINLTNNVDKRMFDGYGDEDILTSQGLIDKINSMSDIDKGYQSLQAAKIRTTFDYLEARAQTGRGVNKQEYESAYKALFGSANPERIQEVLRSEVENSMNRYEVDVKTVRQSPIGAKLADQRGGVFDPTIDPRDTITSILPDASKAWLKNGTQFPDTRVQGQPQTQQPQTRVQLPSDPAEATKMYNSLPHGASYTDPTGKPRIKP